MNNCGAPAAQILNWGGVELLVFKEERIIGTAGGASRRPYEWSAGYIFLAAMVGMAVD